MKWGNSVPLIGYLNWGNTVSPIRKGVYVYVESEIEKIDRSFLDDAKQIIDKGRNAAYGAVNAAMISTYWHLGRRIVEEEQKGQQRAEYGEKFDPPAFR